MFEVIIQGTIKRTDLSGTSLLGLYIIVFGTGLLFAPLISALVAADAFKLPGPGAYGASLLAYFGFAFVCMTSANTNVNKFVFWLAAVPFCYFTLTMLSFTVFFLDKEDVNGDAIKIQRIAKISLVTTGILVAVNPYSYLVFTPRP